MKAMLAAALIAAQTISTAGAASAAELPAVERSGEVRMGGFAGARVQLPLGGKRQQIRATLTAAPTLRSVQSSGEQRLRIGQGLELGVEGGQTRFDLAGQPVAQLAKGGAGPDGDRRNLSTLGAIAIGVGVVLIGLYFLAESCRKGEICGSE